MVRFTAPPKTTNFRSAVKSLSPPWLAGNTGYRLMYSLAIQLDTLAEYLRIGCLQGFPTYCLEESLPELGLDRMIRRGPSEPSANYRERLRTSKTVWKRAGNALTLLSQLVAYFQPNPPKIRYVTSGPDGFGNICSEWWTYESGTYSYYRSTPANWIWDSADETGDYRFWIIVYTNLLPRWSWDDGSIWDQPGLLWDYAEGNVIHDLNSLIEQFKAAGSHLGGLIYYPVSITDDWVPTNIPGYPLPNGGWSVESARFPGPQYFFVPGD